MSMAVDVAEFSPAGADQLRRAMGSKRSTRKMDRLRGRFFHGAAANGITWELAERIFEQIRAFSGYGFPSLPWVQQSEGFSREPEGSFRPRLGLDPWVRGLIFTPTC